MSPDPDGRGDDGGFNDRVERRMAFPPASGRPTATDGGRTTDTEERHWRTNDALAVLLLVSLPAMVAASAYGLVDLGAVPVGVTTAWLLSVLTAVAWAFGPALLETASGAIE